MIINIPAQKIATHSEVDAENKKLRSVSQAIDLACKSSTPHFWEEEGTELADIDSAYRLGIWYRGQSNKCWHLIPSVFREEKPSSKSIKVFDEGSMFYHFMFRSAEYRLGHKNSFEWLCLMQHYGLPTRLLDWTESILIALYFAVTETNDEHDGALYILNARKLNYLVDNVIIPHEGRGIKTPDQFETVVRSEMARYSSYYDLLRSQEISVCDKSDIPSRDFLEKSSKILLSEDSEPNNFPNSEGLMEPDSAVVRFVNNLSLPIAVFPYRNNARMVAQYSMFTLHGGKIHTIRQKHSQGPRIFAPTHLSILDGYCVQNKHGRVMKKFIIEKRNKKRIRDELTNIGIHEGTLYPEVEQQSEYIRKIWLFEPLGKENC